MMRAALAIARCPKAELFAQDPLVERMAGIMQQDERGHLVHRHVDLDDAADFEVVGGGGDRPLVGFHDLDRHARGIPEQARRANGGGGRATAASAPSAARRAAGSAR